ncbi:hypothetical protein B9Z55_018289 [Caenorhabditis nigoni]|nr:hypothetical protein B9Z55_018289 [Caenorhabditis nigoni]
MVIGTVMVVNHARHDRQYAHALQKRRPIAQPIGCYSNDHKGIEAVLKLIHQNGFQQASLWIGAVRKASCPRAGIWAPIDTFEWTDEQTTGTDGFDWFSAPGNIQPDGLWKHGWGTV